MISVIQNGDSYDLKFSYDPYAISIVKTVPGRCWDSNRKVWSIPSNRLGFLMNAVKGTPYENQLFIQSNEHLQENQTLDTTTAIPDIDISNVPFYVEEGSKPFNHQLDFMKYAIHRQMVGKRSGFILADHQGLGKTIEVLNLAMYNRSTRHSKHCLVICCVNSAKYNWKADVFKHTNGKEDPYILGTRLKKDKIHFRCDTGGIEKLEDLRTGHMYSDSLAPELPYFIVVNIEAFRYKVGKLYMFTKEVIKYVNDGLIDMIAIDEIHKNASPSSIQGKQLLEIKKQCTKNVEWIPMTGTPITSKPTDLYLPLKLVDAHQYSNFYSWNNRFCIKGGFGDKEIVGYKNMPLLKGMLQDNMIRRLKQDVLDLPDKIYYTEYVENTPVQKALYEKIAQELKRDRDSIVNEMNPLARFMKLRQVNGSPELVDDTITVDSKYISKNAKLSKLLELLDDAIDDGEKVIVFSNWVEPLRTLYRFVSKKYKTCCYTGTMSPDAREQHKQAFINNPEYKVMIGTIGALGTSHTLTVASTIIFYDECWNPSDREQAEDRVHRIGAKFPVKIKTIITKDTVDERVHYILSKKESIANYIVDDSLDVYKNPKLFDLLLSDTIVKK